jgi:hypothetical protein
MHSMPKRDGFWPQAAISSTGKRPLAAEHVKGCEFSSRSHQLRDGDVPL